MIALAGDCSYAAPVPVASPRTAPVKARLQAWLGECSDDFLLEDAISGALGMEPAAAGRSVRTSIGMMLARLGCARVEQRTRTNRFVYKPCADPAPVASPRTAPVKARLQAWLGECSDDFLLEDAISGALGMVPAAAGRSVRTSVGMMLAKLGCARVEQRTKTNRFVYKRQQRNAASSQTVASRSTDSEVSR